MFDVIRVGKWLHNLTDSVWNDETAPYATTQQAESDLRNYCDSYGLQLIVLGSECYVDGLLTYEIRESKR